MLDLDFFKRYNDEHGHLAGDRLLRAAAAAWQATLRTTDVLARWGGEEFALMLPGCDGAGAAVLIERLRGTLPDGVDVLGRRGAPTAGPRRARWSTRPTRRSTPAKATGRDRVVVGAAGDGARQRQPRSSSTTVSPTASIDASDSWS